MRATKNWRMTGIVASPTWPILDSSMGTSRQPMTFWLWYRATASSVRICERRRSASRERNTCATP